MNMKNGYTYKSSELTYAHRYLDSFLISILNQEKIDHSKNLSVLELGCGNGSFSHVISEMGFNVTAVDDSQSGITEAKKAFPQIKFIQQSIYEISETELNNLYDIVIAIEVIEHLMYPSMLIKQANKYLKTGGMLILTTPYHGYVKNLGLSLFNVWDRHFSVHESVGHVKFFSKKTLQEVVKKHGFIVQKWFFAGRFPLLWKSMICVAVKNK